MESCDYTGREASAHVKRQPEADDWRPHVKLEKRRMEREQHSSDATLDYRATSMRSPHRRDDAESTPPDGPQHKKLKVKIRLNPSAADQPSRS